MKKIIRIFFICMFIMSTLNSATAQTKKSYTSLKKLEGYAVGIYYSKSFEKRAAEIGALMGRAKAYMNTALNSNPDITVLVLNETDWKTYAAMLVYGFPHPPDNYTLAVAATDNDFWKSYIPPVDNLPVPLSNKIKATYNSGEGKLSMRPFFDLLAIHEMAHLYHNQEKKSFPRKWLTELFANVFLHTYIAEKEPVLLPALETFPAMVVGAGSSEYKYTSLKDFEELYINVGAKNYGWYQTRLHAAAKSIYNAGGTKPLHAMWDHLSIDNNISDEELISLLKEKVHPEIAKVALTW